MELLVPWLILYPPFMNLLSLTQWGACLIEPINFLIRPGSSFPVESWPFGEWSSWSEEFLCSAFVIFETFLAFAIEGKVVWKVNIRN